MTMRLLGSIAVAFALLSAQPASSQNSEKIIQNRLIDRATVYFSWQDASVTAHGKNLISEFIVKHRDEPSIVFLIQGYNDTDGARGDNLVLSAQMAASVANQIIGLGVREKRVFLEAFGESNLARSTSDNIREPLNRRVMILAIRPGSAEG